MVFEGCFQPFRMGNSKEDLKKHSSLHRRLYAPPPLPDLPDRVNRKPLQQGRSNLRSPTPTYYLAGGGCHIDVCVCVRMSLYIHTYLHTYVPTYIHYMHDTHYTHYTHYKHYKHYITYIPHIPHMPHIPYIPYISYIPYITIHYITLHYITLHYITYIHTLHYITLHYTT